MKFLVVKDEFATRLIFQKIIREYGEVHMGSGRTAAKQHVHQTHSVSTGHRYFWNLLQNQIDRRNPHELQGKNLQKSAHHLISAA